MLLRLTITGPNTVGGLAIYRFLPSPTTGELLTIEFLPATVEDYNRALRNAQAVVARGGGQNCSLAAPQLPRVLRALGHEAVAPRIGLTLWPNWEPSPAGGAVGLAGRAIRVPEAAVMSGI
jgi:hypothetical protein